LIVCGLAAESEEEQLVKVVAQVMCRFKEVNALGFFPYEVFPSFFFCIPQQCPSAGQFFWFFLVCYAATQLAIQLQQECTQMVCSNREARKRPAQAEFLFFQFSFFFFKAATQLARQVQQERTKVVCNK